MTPQDKTPENMIKDLGVFCGIVRPGGRDLYNCSSNVGQTTIHKDSSFSQSPDSSCIVTL